MADPDGNSDTSLGSRAVVRLVNISENIEQSLGRNCDRSSALEPTAEPDLGLALIRSPLRRLWSVAGF